MKIDAELCEIIKAYWEDFVNKRKEKFVIEKAIPIIWFGNIEKYFNSKIKIVTISVNPSDIEFRKNKTSEEYSFHRFPGAETIYEKISLNDEDLKLLYSLLNQYFDQNPYTKWFDFYDNRKNNSLLHLLNASYYQDKPNCAIHIDLQSALATNPTWKNLSNDQKNVLPNHKLTKQLISKLNPDIILYSAAKEELKNVLDIDIHSPAISRKINGRQMLSKYKFNNKPLIYGYYSGVPFNPIKRTDVADFMQECNLLKDV